MTDLGHEPQDLLLRHAAGGLDPAFALLIETHLSLSPSSRRLHLQFEALGGALLDRIEPAQVDPAALNRALNALEDEQAGIVGPADAPKFARHPDMPEGFSLPPPLRDVDIDAWRWIAPGVRSARVALPESSGARAFLLEISAGVTVPKHGHEGDEATCVLRGGFRDQDAHFGPGDVAHVDATIEHDIVVDPGFPCLCLIAMEGRTVPSGWFGRLYQKFRDI
jgi:putative transcriptional regulator